MPRILRAPFPGEGWSLALGDVVGPAQEDWEVKEAGEAGPGSGLCQTALGRPRGVYLDFLIIIFTFFLLMKKF